MNQFKQEAVCRMKRLGLLSENIKANESSGVLSKTILEVLTVSLTVGEQGRVQAFENMFKEEGLIYAFT